MLVEIKVPSVGESIREGTLSRWLKKNGALVQAGEPVFELETEKATTEVPAPAMGKLQIAVPEGKTIAVGSVVGRIDDSAQVSPRDDGTKQTGAGKTAAQTAVETQIDKDKTGAPAIESANKSGSHSDALMSPAARQLVEEQGIDVAELHGSGRGGRVTKEDVLSFLQSRAGTSRPKDVESTPPSMAEERDEQKQTAPGGQAKLAESSLDNRMTRRPMSSIRQRIADRLVASQKNTATLTTFNEADLSAILGLRKDFQDRFREKYDINLGFMSFFIKSCADALRAFPILNARIDGSDIVFQKFFNIGVAVSTERGLMVPIVRNVEQLTFGQLEKRIAELAQKARDGKIAVDDLQGGTFTITNGGVFGSLLSTPILNPPQSAILGMHSIQKRPICIDDQVVIRPMMYLALSYDHRLVDGHEAVQFLVRVKECVEKPERLLLEV